MLHVYRDRIINRVFARAVMTTRNVRSFNVSPTAVDLPVRSRDD